MRYLLLTLAILATTLGRTQDGETQLTKDEVGRIMGALGFVYGQQYTLNQIATYIPELKLDAVRSQLLYNSEFSDATNNMENTIRKTFGDAWLKQYHDNMISELQGLIQYEQMDYEEARSFITKVEDRSKGKIFESPYFETILHYNYLYEPHQEILSGYLQTFKTKGHPKAGGLELQIKTPISFSSEEGDRPHVIQRFKSNEGNGPALIILLIKPIPEKEGRIDARENPEIIDEELAREITEENGIFKSYNRINIDGIPFAMCEYSTSKESLLGNIETSGIHFFTIIDNQFILISGSCRHDDGTNTSYFEYLPTFKLIANSFIYLGQY
jgi:hypothetical protein